MPTLIWCDRAPFEVEETPKEVAQLIADCSPTAFIPLKLKDGRHFALAVSKISAFGVPYEA